MGTVTIAVTMATTTVVDDDDKNGGGDADGYNIDDIEDAHAEYDDDGDDDDDASGPREGPGGVG